MNEEESEEIANKLYISFMFYAFCFCVIGFLMGFGFAKMSTPVHKPVDTEIIYVSEQFDWEKFIQAVAFVESECNPKAIGKSNDVGLLQITPIMVKEANRITGYNKYTLNCRLDSLKSIEIFNVVQDYHNSLKCPIKACMIWNPKAKIEYAYKVMSRYDEIKNKQYD